MKIAVFFNDEPVVEVGQDWFEKLKRHAFEAGQRRARLCLHRSPDDSLHEMIIAFHRDTLVRPHRHTTKTESFHVIEGELDVLLFDNDGRPTRAIELGEAGTGKAQVYRLSSPVWHSVILRTEYAIIHEVTSGPFRVEESDFAPWAPAQPDELRRFLSVSIGQVRAR
jgi:cupin fold WbuC family metalloprotein